MKWLEVTHMKRVVDPGSETQDSFLQSLLLNEGRDSGALHRDQHMLGYLSQKRSQNAD